MDMTKKLLKLIKENPNSPIIPMIDGDVARDVKMWEQGVIENMEVRHYVEGISQLWFEDDPMEELLKDVGFYIGEEKGKVSTEEIEEFCSEMTWKCGIFVYIC